MKKQDSLEKQIENVLRHYYLDSYNRVAYYKNCTKAIMKLLHQLGEKE